MNSGQVWNVFSDIQQARGETLVLILRLRQGIVVYRKQNWVVMRWLSLSPPAQPGKRNQTQPANGQGPGRQGRGKRAPQTVRSLPTLFFWQRYLEDVSSVRTLRQWKGGYWC